MWPIGYVRQLLGSPPRHRPASSSIEDILRHIDEHHAGGRAARETEGGTQRQERLAYEIEAERRRAENERYRELARQAEAQRRALFNGPWFERFEDATNREGRVLPEPASERLAELQERTGLSVRVTAAAYDVNTYCWVSSSRGAWDGAAVLIWVRPHCGLIADSPWLCAACEGVTGRADLQQIAANVLAAIDSAPEAPCGKPLGSELAARLAVFFGEPMPGHRPRPSSPATTHSHEDLICNWILQPGDRVDMDCPLAELQNSRVCVEADGFSSLHAEYQAVAIYLPPPAGGFGRPRIFLGGAFETNRRRH